MKIKAIVFLLMIGQTVIGQQKPNTAEPVQTKTTFTTTLAKRGSGEWTKELVRALIDSPIVVKDEKGKTYPVVRFTLNYTFSTVYVDSETKQRKTRKDFRSQLFESSTLSDVWKASIKENARNGDQMLFNDVIIRMPDGKKRMVDDLTIYIK